MKTFLRKLGWAIQRPRKEADLRDELEFHLAEEADERKASGLDETLRSDGQTETALSPPNFMSLREGVDEQEIGAFSSVAGFMDTQLTLTGVGEARRVEATRIDARFFEVLGV
jgi:hypothetical protein